jgi:hypothetical protein
MPHRWPTGTCAQAIRCRCACADTHARRRGRADRGLPPARRAGLCDATRRGSSWFTRSRRGHRACTGGLRARGRDIAARAKASMFSRRLPGSDSRGPRVCRHSFLSDRRWGGGLDQTELPPGAWCCRLCRCADAAGARRGRSRAGLPIAYEGFGLPPLEALAAAPRSSPAICRRCAKCSVGTRAWYRRTIPTRSQPRYTACSPSHRTPEPAPRPGSTRGAFTWRRCAELTLAAYRSAVV